MFISDLSNWKLLLFGLKDCVMSRDIPSCARSDMRLCLKGQGSTGSNSSFTKVMKKETWVLQTEPCLLLHYSHKGRVWPLPSLALQEDVLPIGRHADTACSRAGRWRTGHCRERLSSPIQSTFSFWSAPAPSRRIYRCNWWLMLTLQ